MRCQGGSKEQNKVPITVAAMEIENIIAYVECAAVAPFSIDLGVACGAFPSGKFEPRSDAIPI